MMMRFAITVTMLTALTTSAMAQRDAVVARANQGWTEFRGPDGNGISQATNLPVSWDNSTKNVAWKQALPGEGWSSPVVAGDQVFVSAAVPAGDGTRSLRLLVLNSRTGKLLDDLELFTQPANSPKIHKKNSHASPTPLIEGDRVYVHFGHQGTACLTLGGKVVWRQQHVQYSPVHGNGGTPIIVDDKLIFSCDGAANPFVVALDKRSGKELWRAARKSDASRKFSFSTPLAIKVDGKTQVISPGSGAVCAYDPDTGDELWRVNYGEGYSVIPKPVFANGLVFACSGYGRPVLFAIRPDGSGDVTNTHVAWQTNQQAPHTPSVLVVGDELYMVSDRGIATCLDAKTGEKHWQERLGGNFSASPSFADGRIYFQSEQGETTVITPGTEYQEVAKSSVGETTFASYAFLEHAILLRSDKHLYRLEAN